MKPRSPAAVWFLLGALALLPVLGGCAGRRTIGDGDGSGTTTAVSRSTGAAGSQTTNRATNNLN